MEVAWIKKKKKTKNTWIVCLPSEIRNPSGNKYQTKQRQKKALAIGQMILYTTQKFN